MKIKFLLLGAASVHCTSGIFDKIASVYAQKEITHLENQKKLQEHQEFMQSELRSE